MRILYCCHLPLDAKLGGAKVYLENAKAMEKLGVSVKIVSPNDYCQDDVEKLPESERIKIIAPQLKEYILKESDNFDVIEFENMYLPYQRSDFPSQVVLVCRSVLLVDHLKHIKFREPVSLRKIIGNIAYGHKRRQELEDRLRLSSICVSNADIVNVPNHLDKTRLIQNGCDSSKIFVSPYGISEELLHTYSSKTREYRSSPTFAFIGSFDFRKGALDLVDIIEFILNKSPSSRIKLLGTMGRFTNTEQVLSFFPKNHHENIEVHHKFLPQDLDSLLSDVQIGLFPSYLESFGFGLLEMTSRKIPCLAYRVPGPCDLLPDHLLFKVGDLKSLYTQLERLIVDRNNWLSSSEQCFLMANTFTWSNSSSKCLNFYSSLLNKL